MLAANDSGMANAFPMPPKAHSGRSFPFPISAFQHFLLPLSPPNPLPPDPGAAQRQSSRGQARKQSAVNHSNIPKTQSVSRTISLFIAFLMLAPAGATAALIAYDQMSGYTGGNLSGQGQGAGWTGNWSSGQSAFTTVPASDLTYSGLTGAEGLGRVSNYSGAGICRTTSLIGSGTLYVGALVKPNNANSGIRLIDMGGPNNNSVLIGQYSANPYNASTTLLYPDLRPEGQGVPGQVGINTGISVTNATAYWVAKIEFNTNGTLDDVRFFVNPASANALATNVRCQRPDQQPEHRRVEHLQCLRRRLDRFRFRRGPDWHRGGRHVRCRARTRVAVDPQQLARRRGGEPPPTEVWCK